LLCPPYCMLDVDFRWTISRGPAARGAAAKRRMRALLCMGSLHGVQ